MTHSNPRTRSRNCAEYLPTNAYCISSPHPSQTPVYVHEESLSSIHSMFLSVRDRSLSSSLSLHVFDLYTLNATTTDNNNASMVREFPAAHTHPTKVTPRGPLVPDYTQKLTKLTQHTKFTQRKFIPSMYTIVLSYTLLI